MKFLFYRPLRVTGEDSNILFWSDTHFNHKCEHWETPLWKARGFNSVEEHNEGLIQRWNEKANSESIFFHLGDFMFGHDAEYIFENIIQKVNFKELYIMPGNHCSGWKQWFEKLNGNVWYVNKNKKVMFLPNYAEAYVNEQLMVLSHYPILSFNKQNSSSGSSIHLFGHTHNNIRKSEVGPIFYKAKVWEVSVENSPNPVTFADVREMFKNRTPVTFDHHNQNTLS